MFTSKRHSKQTNLPSQHSSPAPNTSSSPLPVTPTFILTDQDPLCISTPPISLVTTQDTDMDLEEIQPHVSHIPRVNDEEDDDTLDQLSSSSSSTSSSPISASLRNDITYAFQHPLRRVISNQDPISDDDDLIPLASSTAFARALNYTPPASSKTNPSPPSPKFIMPKISMPSRPPFTPDGLAITKLKLLIAGNSQTGKSALLHAMAQTSREIIHVDDTPTPVTDSHGLFLWEYLASTRPHLDYDDSDSPLDTTPPSSSSNFSARRRSSASVTQSLSLSSDIAALEKNICLVDTLGYSSHPSLMDRVGAYLHAAFDKTATLVNPSNKEALSILSSSSSLSAIPMVDACIYSIASPLSPQDIAYMTLLARYAPVIPVIAPSASPADIPRLKLAILREMKHADVPPFLFDVSLDEAIDHAKHAILDQSIVDLGCPQPASLFPCAIASDLPDLCAHIFSYHGSTWLRHAAAKKFAAWCADQTIRAPPQPLTQHSTCLINRDKRVQVARIPKAASVPDAQTDLLIPPDFFVALEPRRLAQSGTAKWVAALARDADKHAQQLVPVAYPSSPHPTSHVFPARLPKNAATCTAITNLDPLGLQHFFATDLWRLALKTISLAVGIKFAAEFWRALVAAARANSAASSPTAILSVADIFAAAGHAVQATGAAARNVLWNLVMAPLEKLVSLLGLVAAPDSQPSPIVFADAQTKHNIRPQSLLAAMFSGELQTSVFSVLVGSFGGM